MLYKLFRPFMYLQHSPERMGPLCQTPSTARCSPSPESVAVYAQSPYYPPRHNAGIHKRSSSRNLRRFRQINNNHVIHKTQSLIINSINNRHKTSASIKYWRRQKLDVDKARWWSMKNPLSMRGTMF
jgi:hypothetical protein